MTQEELNTLNNVAKLDAKQKEMVSEMENLISPIVNDVLSRQNLKEMEQLTLLLPDGIFRKKVYAELCKCLSFLNC